MRKRVNWEGVFPAVTTQFHDDLSLDIDATARVMEGLIRDGVSGLIVCGTVGENCSLAKMEKIAVMEAGKAVARGRVPVISGIAEFTSAFAIDMAKEAAPIGLDGVVVMPALVYSSKPHDTAAHFRSVATAPAREGGRRRARGVGGAVADVLFERRLVRVLGGA